MAKVELNEEMLDDVLGGIAYENFTNTIGVDADHLVYKFDNFDDVMAYYRANKGKYASLSSSARSAELIKGMLAAGIIHE